MPFITALLAIGAAAASIIGTAVSSSSASDDTRKQREHAQELFERQEKQRLENEKAAKKQAFLKAFNIGTNIRPKQLPGIRPTIFSDRKQNIANIFGGISQGLGAAASSDFFNQPFTGGATPGSTINYKPFQDPKPFV